MRRGVVHLIGAMATVWVALGCSSSHGSGDGDGGRAGFDAGPDRGGDGSVVEPLPRHDGAVPEPPDGVVVCGTETCETGQECCLLTLRCFDPGDPSGCEVPPDAAGDPEACVSNLDCDEGELCERADIFDPEGESMELPACGGGVGHCVMMRGPDLCGPDPVCGCDGRTYSDSCAASRAGVRVSWPWRCGGSPSDASLWMCDAAHPDCMDGWTCDVALGRCVEDDPFIACGIDAQCPDGHFCCGIVGACMPSDCPECCFVPPPGTSYPCRDNDDCRVLDEARGYETYGRESFFYCDRAGCTETGGCRSREMECGGELAPVCGCDGVTYSNPCWASEAGASIASAGECP